MKTNIKFTDTEHDDKLRGYVEQKVDSFTKLLSESELDSAICNVELKKDTQHQNGDVCTAEVTLEVKGKIYRVSKTEPTLEKAMDKVKDDVLESLRTEKGKHRDSHRKGASQAKEMLREVE